MSVVVPNQRNTRPAASTCGTARVRHQRQAPSWRRTRCSARHSLRFALASFQMSH
jgi:hypothetical protein